jgi:hypothetical protein
MMTAMRGAASSFKRQVLLCGKAWPETATDNALPRAHKTVQKQARKLGRLTQKLKPM